MKKSTMIGETAKRELSFSWTHGLVTDLACWLIGHSLHDGQGDSIYCDRCWRWGEKQAHETAALRTKEGEGR